MRSSKRGRATRKKAKTWVCWDIDSCPVPAGYDAHLVGSSIESALYKKGYSGPLTITALGNLKLTLTRTPDVLPALSATGILLNHVRGFDDIFGEFLRWTRSNRGPANILFITGREHDQISSEWFSALEHQGYTILHASPRGFPQAYENSYLWEHLLLVPMERSKTNCLSAGETFLCSTCDTCTGKSFVDFTRHLNSRAHVELEFVSLLPFFRKRKGNMKPFHLSDFINKKPKVSWYEDDRRSL